MEDEQKMVFFWHGQNVEDLSHEELLDAVKMLITMSDDAHKSLIRTHEMYKTIDAARRARGLLY